MQISFVDMVGDEAVFAAEHFGRAPLLRRAALAEPQQLFSISDADKLLRNDSLRLPYLSLRKDGQTILPEAFARQIDVQGSTVVDAVDPELVYKLFHSGATVVWNCLNHYHHDMRQLAAAVGRVFATEGDAVAFLTGLGRSNTPIHHDEVDVYVIQVEGARRWRVWPRRGSGRKYRYEVESLGDPLLDVVLNPGDVLYVPNNTPHAVDSEEQVSLHVSVTVRPRRWDDLLRSTVDRLLADETFVEFPWLDGQRNPEVLPTLAERIGLLAQRLTALDAGAELGELIQVGAPEGSGGDSFTAAVSVETMSPSTVVRRTSLPVTFAETEERVEARIGDRKIAMPHVIADTLRQLSPSDEAAAGMLFTGVEEDRSVRLTKDFVRLGVFAIAG